MSLSGRGGRESELLLSFNAGCFPVLLKISIFFFISLLVGKSFFLPSLTSFASPTKRVMADHTRIGEPEKSAFPDNCKILYNSIRCFFGGL